MDLSPNDIRNYEFNTQMRGFDREEVRNLLEQVATVIENLKQEHLKVSMEADSLKTQISGLRQFEDTIKSAAIDARRHADMTIENAKKEAELILSRAKTEAEEIVGSRASKVTEFQDQISKLEVTRHSYLNKLRNLIQSHLEMIDEVVDIQPGTAPASVKPPGPTASIEVTESTEYSRQKLETIADEPSASQAIKTEEAQAAERIVPVTPPSAPTAGPPDTPESDSPEPAETQTPQAVVDTPGFPEEPKRVDTQPTRTDVTEQPQPAERPVDPELAAALERYQHQPIPARAEQPPASHTGESSPGPGEIVETNSRAEDIPPGFIPADDRPAESATTDKVQVDGNGEDDVTEHNAIDIDNNGKQNRQSVEPGDLAKELDEVAEKFEEEMNKAAQS